MCFYGTGREVRYTHKKYIKGHPDIRKVGRRMENKIIYSEPEDYFPKDIREKYFGKDFGKDSDALVSEQKELIIAERIIQGVAEYFHLDPEGIKYPIRNADYVKARQICDYLCRELTNLTLLDIAGILHKPPHSNIIHGFMRISEEIQTNEELKEQIEEIKRGSGC